MPLIDTNKLPDLFVAPGWDDLTILVERYGWKIIGELPNTRPGFTKLKLQRGEMADAVLAASPTVLRISDVKGKSVCGVIPLWLAMHTTAWLVAEPDISPMFVESFALENADTALTQWRIAAYDVVRKGASA